MSHRMHSSMYSMFMLAVALVPIAALLPPGVVSACRRDDVKPLRRLLDKGAFDVNDVDDEGSTLLMIAAFDVRVPHVRLLLERGADPNLADHDGGNALLNAGIIASGFAHSHISLSQAEAAAAAREIGIMLIQSGARFLPLPKGVPEALMEGPKSWYAEVREVADGVREVADGMRESRPHGWNDDVNYIDPVSGCTRLHTATINGNVDIVRRLLKGGADPDVLTKRPTKRAQETIPSLANAEEGSTALMLAVPNGNAPIVELLIKAGASLDLRNRYDNTALFLAASKGNVGIVRRLLDAGAHVDRRGGGSGAGDESSTPLDYAAHAGHSEVVGLLLKAGAELEARSEPGGNTPLISALKAGTCLKGKKPRKQGEGALAQLIAAGANANARQRDGDTALLVAISTGRLHLVTMLLDAGADPNLPSAAVDGASATTEEGCTPLIAAAAYGEPEMARVLLDAGASASTRDGEGFRAIDWALAENSKPDVAAGRKVTAQILRSKTPSPALAPYGPKHSRAQSSEGSSGWFVPVFVSVCVGLVSLVLNLILRYQNAAEAGEQPREAEGRRRGRGRRGNGQDRGRGGNGQRQGRGRGQARAAADPPAPMPAPTPTPPVAYTTVDEPDWWLALTDFHDDLDAAARQDRPDFLCPVTAEIMRAPYLLVDGHESLHTYEYNVLVNWFITEGNDSDPVRNTRIEPARRNFISDGRLGREIRSWCEEKVRKWRQELKSQASASTDSAAARTDVHVFVDHSNALIGALKAGTKLDLARLAQCVEAGREVRERVVLGSLETERNRAAWEQLGYTVTADTRPGKEHLIDDALHAQLMRTAAKRFDPARVIALVTGDGNDNEGRTTFPQCIEEALKNDWHVELHSWRRSMNRVYVAFAEQYPTHFSFHILDSSLAVVAGWA